MSGKTTDTTALEAMDKARVLHPATSIADHLRTGPRIMSEGAGVWLTDLEGKRYLDAVAGLWCVNVGYGRAEIGDAMAAQARRLGYYHTFSSMSNEPQIRLADRLLGLVPAGMSKVFFGNSGSDANDTQVKLVWYYNNLRGRPRKKKIIARLQGYHGSTVASASLTGLPMFHRAFDLPIGNILHAATPYPYRSGAPGQSEEAHAAQLAAELDQLIEREGPDTVAAFIAEPVMGAGGVLVPPRTYFERVQAVLRKHDVLMIADEVICGFGRLGRMFGCDVYGIQPDLMTVAKGLTSGYFPLSAVILSEQVWSVLQAGSPEIGAFAHGFTYSGHPVGAAAAMANLDILLGEDLVGNAARTGAYLQAALRERIGAHPLVGEVRGLGLIAGVELVADRQTRQPFDAALKVAQRVSAHCLEHGLIVRALPVGHVVALSPPLCITRPEIDRVVEGLERAVRAVADDLATQGAWKAA
ncbi:MAG TPA: aminotransferase [Methylomirabilota bacterium]|jgi:L-2,4-diaminobutyrate transaminase|nr:aminotransferase [Methylomirabilota bacterium]